MGTAFLLGIGLVLGLIFAFAAAEKFRVLGIALLVGVVVISGAFLFGGVPILF